jgi:hypothetical protein
MSKNNNVNPDYYKLAGRDRSGNTVAKAPQSGATEHDAKKARERFEKRQQQQKKKR